MKKHVKSLLERLANNRIWIEHTTDESDLEQFLALVRPVAVKPGLKRYGGDSDGAYLLPSHIEGITALISPGVSTEITFDLAFANMGVPVFMADASVAGPPVNHKNFNFYKKFICVKRNDVCMTLDDLCDEIPLERTGDWILQMDIEGAEYASLLSLKEETLKRFRIMAIEFHHLPQLYSRFSFPIIKAVFEKLLLHHNVVHIHPNNCCGSVRRGKLDIPQLMEFTFYRKDRGVVDNTTLLDFPHSEDIDITVENPPLVLPDCWR